MKDSYEKIYHESEERHWWFKARRETIVNHLERIDDKKNKTLLDIGCSTGVLLNSIMKVGLKPENLYGIDISEKAIKRAKKKGVKNAYVMDAQTITLDKNQFDIIISSDCLEHLQDDKKALINWHKLLKKKGLLILYVPAMMSLWSIHDEANMHYRRYSKKEILSKITKAGFIILKSGYWNCLLFIPIWLTRRITNLFKIKDNKDKGNVFAFHPLINFLLFKLLIFENKISKFIGFPFGVSLYVIVKK